MRRFKIVRSDTDTMTSHSGLALVGGAVAHTRLAKDLGQIPLRHGIAHAIQHLLVGGFECGSTYFFLS